MAEPTNMKGESLKVKKLHDDAIVPTRATEGSIGYDLHAYDEAILPKNERRSVGTGISIAIPEGHYGRIAPRSGLAFILGIQVLAGVVDPDYRGEIKVILYYGGAKKEIDTHRIRKGDRIAQLILEKVSTVPVEVVEELDETERGDCGFGSSGK